MTQAALGEKAKMERTDISRAESGKLRLGPNRLARVADALQVTPLELDARAEPGRALLLEDLLAELAENDDEILENQKEALTTQRGMLDELQAIHEALDILLGGAGNQPKRSGGSQ